MNNINFSIDFEFNRSSGGYVIKKTITRGDTKENHDMFMAQAVADDFVKFYNENNFNEETREQQYRRALNENTQQN